MNFMDDWKLTPYRAAVHRPTRTAVIADLHLGYDAVRRASGEAVPELGWKRTRQHLLQLLQHYVIDHIVIAGDLVEHGSETEAAIQLVRWLRKQRVGVALIPGNHDRRLPAIDGLEVFPEGVPLGSWRVLHEPIADSVEPRVVGHIHPIIALPSATGKAACFLSHPRYLLLPAFSEDTAGINVLPSRRYDDFCCHAIVGSRVLRLGLVKEVRRRFAQSTAVPIRAGVGFRPG